MHVGLRCASGVGVTASVCCGLLQSLMIIVIACVLGIRPAYMEYATLFVTTLSLLITTFSHAH